ncbi:MAG TPA: hypothetical protein VIG50_15845, partial [Vicinamibacteria bacterium]
MRCTQVLCATVLAVRVALAPAAAAESYRVKSRALATVFVSVGEAGRFARGERLRVVAGDATVAEMEVVALYPGMVACRVLSSTRAVVAGDVVLRSAPRTAAGAAPGGKAPEVPAPRRAAPPSPPPPVKPPPRPPAPAAAGADGAAPHATNGNGNGTPARATTASFRVKYRSSANAYLDAGGPAGLSVGDRLRVAAG